MCRNIVTTPSDLELWTHEFSYVSLIWLICGTINSRTLRAMDMRLVPLDVYTSGAVVVKSLHSSLDCWTCSRLCENAVNSGLLEASQNGQIQAPVAQERRVL